MACPALGVSRASCVAQYERHNPTPHASPFMVARSRRLEDCVDLKELALSLQLHV
jgi:hypothetical protein